MFPRGYYHTSIPMSIHPTEESHFCTFPTGIGFKIPRNINIQSKNRDVVQAKTQNQSRLDVGHRTTSSTISSLSTLAEP
ncbi:hypothetical protein Ccrd_026558 [Cynara cardunculus var. scolymus]|uniref:Uncharacterized protein n=1 Tax=Cynara cardunculus var. scolymus TaxID=59895 RepID=A0A103NKH7_CYNCS|nr:hypothetical protein Ccrd_026558 [Cynara cardunculus var. scolymus]